MFIKESTDTNINYAQRSENIIPQTKNFAISRIESSKLEILTNYFDIVPDLRLVTKYNFPLYSIRLRTPGINLLLEDMAKEYNIKYDCKGFIFKDRAFSIDSFHSKGLFNDKNRDMIDINFEDLLPSERKGIIINFSNSDSRLMHTSPIIFGRHKNGKKYIVLMDPYFYFFNDADTDCLSMSQMKYFKNEYPDADIYAHDNIFLKDQNSCSVLAIEYIKNLLTNDNILNKILSSQDMAILVDSNRKYEFRKFDIPEDFMYLNQSIKEMENIEFYDKTPVIKNCLYRRMRSSYNPNYFFTFKDDEFKEKKINLRLHLSGHIYSKRIMEILKNSKNQIKINYDPNYWIKTILNTSENKDRDFMRFLIKLRRALRPKTDIKKTPSILSEDTLLEIVN